MNLSGQVAVVTGSGRGIGAAVAKRLAVAGASVVVNAARSEKQLASVAQDLMQLGSPVEAVVRDVSTEEGARELVDRAVGRFGRLDILVNNAGRNRDVPFLRMSVEDLEVPLRSQLYSTFLCSQQAAAIMLAQGSGRILNIGAATGIHGRAGGANFCMAKAAIMTLTKCLALELGPEIQVNCLVPGFTATDEVLTRFGMDDPARREQWASRVPLRRMATAEEIAQWAAWLCAEAPYATGQLFFVNGGSYLG